MSSSKKHQSEVVVIGGGIIGCATAFFLRQRGVGVTVLERGLVGSEQSGRAWGFIRQQGRHPAEIPLAVIASRMWVSLERELEADLEFVRDGIVVAAETDDDVRRLEEAMFVAKTHQLGSRLLTGKQTQEFAVGSDRTWRAGLLTPDDGHAEPIKATLAFAKAARALGAAIHEGTRVLGVETANGAVSGVVTPDRIYQAPVVICAAGIGAAELSRTINVALPIKVVRASVSQTNRAVPTMTTAFWCPHVAFRPKRDGSFYIGNGYREIDAEFDVTADVLRDLWKFVPALVANWHVTKLRFGRVFLEDLVHRFSPNRIFQPLSEPRVSADLVKRNEQGFYDAFPRLLGLGLARSWAGRIDVTPDLIPIIGSAERPSNYYIAAGFNGHGFALSPVVAKVLADIVVDGRTSVDLRSFRLSRFMEEKSRPHPDAL